MPSKIQDKYAKKAKPPGSGALAKGRAAQLEAAEKAAVRGTPTKTGRRK